MPERPTPPPPSDAPRAPLFSAGEIRMAFIGSAVGMVGLLVVILLLASSRPQGEFRVADDSQFRALLAETAGALDGYELLENGRARIDIDRAIELVAQRGVDLPLTAIGSTPAAQADAGAPAGEVEGEVADTAAAGGEGADGEALYATNCASCHQAQGQGIPGAFPPLADGHMPSLVAAEGGRDFLLHVLVYGMQGAIEVEGQGYNGVMPPWQQLSDDEIAAVLNHELTAWGNEDALPDGFQPIAADEVAAVRGEDVTPADVLEMRPGPDAPPADQGGGAEAATDEAAQGDMPQDDAAGGGEDAATEEPAAAEDAADTPADVGAAADNADAEAQDDAAADVDGAAAYAANCASCHQAQGQGIPGAFPPLADGHMPSLVAAEGGRDFLLHVLVYGMQGAIDVGGRTYSGLMPAWSQLDDATIAAVLNHELTAWGNEDALPDGFQPIAAGEVAAVRGEDVTPTDVLEMRPALD